MNLCAQHVAARFLDLVAKSRSQERREERDEEVENNILHAEPHLLTAWRKNKHLFKGTPEERFTRFLDWVHDHPGESMAAAAEAAERTMRKWEREQRRLQKEEAAAAKAEAKRLEEAKRVSYGDRSPKQVYGEILKVIQGARGE